jgi:hypothetical protein
MKTSIILPFNLAEDIIQRIYQRLGLIELKMIMRIWTKLES